MTPQELKASILQLAIQGKLVEQRPEEGTSEELFQQIQAEKQRLIKAGTIKKEKPLPEIAEGEIPFDIPENWRYVRLGEISTIEAGGTPSRAEPAYWNGTIPWVKIGDISAKHVSEVTEYITESGLNNSSAKVFPKGTLLYTVFATIGTVGILDMDAATNQAIVGIKLYGGVDTDYMYYVAMGLKYILVSKARGMAQLNINQKILRDTCIPLPPLAEQKRIVAKIEELLPYVDRYEQAWSKLEDFNKRFPVDMQKSILQMAIQGKLVEQRPDEGTGEELYQQIQAEKQRLIKAGTIKKEKPLPEITEDEIPFDIPENWKWVRLGAVIDMLSGFAFKSTDFKESGRYRLLRGINLSVGNTRWDDTVYVNEVADKLNTYRLLNGDVLIGLDRPWISDGIRVAIYDESEDTYLVQRVLRIRETSAITKEYIALLLRSNLFKNAVEGQTTGISVPHISPGQVGNVAIPLPPLAEQKRIVAKLEEILPLCDRLK